MDFARELTKMLEGAADRVGEVSRVFEEDAQSFDNILIRRGGPMLRPGLRKTPAEAKEFDMSTEEGKFLLQREAMLEDALEGM